MGDISIIEFGVYAFFAYSSMLMLIISTIKEIPMTKALTIARSIYLIPGILCAGILSTVGRDITLPTVSTNSTTIAVNSSEVFTEINTQTQTMTLLDPVWIWVHIMISLVLTFYVISQVLILMGVGPSKQQN